MSNYQTLIQRFDIDDHIYIHGEWRVKTTALKNRLNTTISKEAYRNSAIEIVHENGARVVVRGSLTLEQATRHDIGIGHVDINKVPGLNAYEEAVDHLYWRLVQHWGVGFYLKDVPDNVKTLEQLKAWLDQKPG